MDFNNFLTILPAFSRQEQKCKKKIKKIFFLKFFFEKISKNIFPKFFQIFFWGKFKKNKIKNSDVFGFFIFCVVFEIFKVKKMVNIRLTPHFGSLCPLPPHPGNVQSVTQVFIATSYSIHFHHILQFSGIQYTFSAHMYYNFEKLYIQFHHILLISGNKYRL